MAKIKKQTTKSKNAAAMDGVYLLKLTLYVLLGSFWFKISKGQNLYVPIPIGFIFGLIFASHEHFQIDRKVEYAALLVSMLVGYFVPYGLYLNF